MVNYKTAYIRFILDKNTPFHIIKLFAELGVYKGDLKAKNQDNRLMRIKEIVHKLNKSKVFPNSYLKISEVAKFEVRISPIVEFEFVSEEVKDAFNGNKINLNPFVYYGYLKEKEQNSNFAEILNKDIIEYLNCKYRKEMSEIYLKTLENILKIKEYSSLLVELSTTSENFYQEFDYLIEYVKPYLITNHPKKVGKVTDSFKTIIRDIYIDKDEFQNIMKSRKCLCEGCSEYSLIYDCPNYQMCKRAFERGIKYVKEMR